LTAGIVVIAQNAIVPAIAWEETRKPYADTVREIVRDSKELSAYRGFDYGFVFYWGRRLPVYNKSLTAEGPEYLLVNETDWANLDPVQRVIYELVPAGSSGRSSNVGRLLLVRRVLVVAPANPSATTPDTPVP
jgi:hypothetical protein